MRRGGAVWRALAASCVLILCAVPAKAVAAHGLVTGFVDAENLYGSADPSVRATWLNRTVESGAGIVRLHVFWSVVAGATPPPDPMNPASGSYEFSATDRAVRDAEAGGLSVLLTVTGAPAWAEGPGAPRLGYRRNLEAQSVGARRLHAGGRRALLRRLRPGRSRARRRRSRRCRRSRSGTSRTCPGNSRRSPKALRRSAPAITGRC